MENVRVNFSKSAIITQKIWRCVNKPVAFEVMSVQRLLCYAPYKRDRGLSRAETGPRAEYRVPGAGVIVMSDSPQK